MQEQRQFQRLVLDSPIPLELSTSAPDNSAPAQSTIVMLYDVSEGGVGILRAVPAAAKQPVSLAFTLPGTDARIEAGAETIWSSESIGRAGFRFVAMSDAARVQLREWIASRAYDTAQPPADVDESEAALPAAASQDERAATNFAESWRAEAMARHEAALPLSSAARSGRMARAAGVVLALVVLGAGSLYLGRLLGSRGRNAPAAATARAAAAPAAPALKPVAATTQPAAQPAAGNVSFPTTLAFDRPGFVVQVGAMIEQTHADHLRTSLEQKNFPAFVFRRSTTRFYRVAVGPYDDAKSAAQAQAQLKAQGFPAIVKPWTPE